MTEPLTQRLHKRADQLMPEWAAVSSAYWYDNGGRPQRDDARLLREAADKIRELESLLWTLESDLGAARWDAEYWRVRHEVASELTKVLTKRRARHGSECPMAGEPLTYPSWNLRECSCRDLLPQ